MFIIGLTVAGQKSIYDTIYYIPVDIYQQVRNSQEHWMIDISSNLQETYDTTVFRICENHSSIKSMKKSN